MTAPEPHCRPVLEDLSDVAAAVQWADDLAAAAALDGEIRSALQLCLEEALANLIQHARPVSGGKEIVIELAADAAGAMLVIVDRCVPFDVTTEAMPGLPSPEDMRAGGQGLRLLRAFAPSLAYRSSDGRNTLSMVFGDAAGLPRR